VYNADKVYDFVFANEELDTDSLRSAGKKEFLKAIDLFKNKKQASASLVHFRNAASTFPDAKTYYELGNALLESKLYSEAVQAYTVAERLDYSPASNLYFNLACASAMVPQNAGNGGSGEALRFLSLAAKSGFSDGKRVEEEPMLASIRESERFREIYVENFVAKENKKSALFAMFVKGFPDVKIPFEMKKKGIQFSYENRMKSIGYDYVAFVPEMENTDFGRDVSNEFFYVGKVRKTDQYVAVLYNSVEYIAEGMVPVYTYLVTYNPEGNRISEKLFSCNCSAEKFKLGSIDEKGITVTEYKRHLERPITEVALENNKVLKEEVVSATHYVFEDSGDIVEVKKTNELASK
jgi:tetratricopeptide (TPR) repeat protein